MYRIRLIVVQYAQHYEGQLMPNVVDAWDEYSLEENGEGYEKSLAAQQARVGTDYEWVRELDVTVPANVVENLAFVPNVAGTIKAVDEHA